ncbi:MAG: hypothetical protein QNK03_10605 [Myxococcota bacterium]|nr:hypothetical protein [Myxococcota bacterium]
MGTSRWQTGVVIVAALGIVGPPTGWGDVPNRVDHQGFLLDGDGVAVTDPALSMVFALYDTPLDGAPLWEETQVVDVQAGVYGVSLGSIVALDPLLFATGSLWLEVRVAGETLFPRTELTSTPYALRAGDADRLGGATAAEFATQGHAHHFSELSGAAGDAQVPDDITIQAADTAEVASFAIRAGEADSLEGFGAAEFAEAAHGHPFTQLVGTASDAQIPDDITVAFAAAAGNADTVDGQHASAFAASGHAHHSLDAADGSPGDALYVDGAGNVGVGTTSPSEKLEVAGNAVITGALNAEGYRNAYQLFDLDPALGLGWEQHVSSGGLAIGSQGGSNRQMVLFADGGGAANVFAITTSEDTGTTWPARLVVEQRGRVGIGTGAPASHLSNSSTLASDGASSTEPSGLNWRIQGAGYAVGIENMADGGDGLLVEAGDHVGNNAKVAHFVAGDTSLLLVREDGHVGIGTTEPSAELDVAGDLHVEGEISWPERTGYYTVGALEFNPESSLADYRRSSRQLYTFADEVFFYAGVHLPDGAVVDRVSCYWADDSPDNATLWLGRRRINTGDGVDMAEMTSRWDSTATNLSFSESITAPVIDNRFYVYYLGLRLPGSVQSDQRVLFKNARIRYTYTSPSQ